MKTPDFNKVLKEFAEEVNLAAKRTLGSRKIGKNRSYGVASRSLQKSLEYKIMQWARARSRMSKAVGSLRTLAIRRRFDSRRLQNKGVIFLK